MRVQRSLLVSATILLLATFCLSTRSEALLQPKVGVCHIPPDDPDNFHTIDVSANALTAHLDHGTC